MAPTKILSMRALDPVLAACVMLATIGAAPASAQSAPLPPAPPGPIAKPPDETDIVVTARRQIEEREALAFTRRASSPVGGQLARFNGDVCPAAIGFSDAVAAALVERMRAVATAAGVPVAKPGCGANVMLIGAEDGSAMIREFERRELPLIAGVAPPDLRALIASHGPVRNWVTTAVENEYGDKPYAEPGPNPPVLQVYSASIVNPPTQQAIQVAVVVIDMTALVGKTTRQIADYAAMRTLAKTRPMAGDGPVGSILSLFEAQETPPAMLSDADLAYLRTLYRTPGNRTDRFQIEQISRDLKKEAQARTKP